MVTLDKPHSFHIWLTCTLMTKFECNRFFFYYYYFFIFFGVWLFVVSAWSFGFFIPATTANEPRLRRIFYPRFYPLHLYSYLNFCERASIFPFECSVLNKRTTGTNIFGKTRSLTGDWTKNNKLTGHSSQYCENKISQQVQWTTYDFWSY